MHVRETGFERVAPWLANFIHTCNPKLHVAAEQLYDNGKLDSLVRKWNEDIAQCSIKSDDLASASLSLHQLSGLFYFLLVIAGMAFIWASGEHVAFLIVRRSRSAKKAASSLQRASRHLSTTLSKHFR
jgi:hypothetical protein